MFNEEKRLYALKLTLAILCSILINSIFNLPLHLGIISILSIISSCTSLKQMEYKSVQMLYSTLIGCASIVPLLAFCNLYRDVKLLHWLLVVLAYSLSLYFGLTVWFVGRVFNIMFFSLITYVINPFSSLGAIKFVFTRIASVIIGALCSWGMNELLVSSAHIQELACLLSLVVQQCTLLIEKYAYQPMLLVEAEEDIALLEKYKDDFMKFFVQYEHKYNNSQRMAMLNLIAVTEELILFALSCRSHTLMYQLSQGYGLFYEKRMMIFQEMMANRYREYQTICQLEG
jgi:uncharacterized membrane protein